MNETQLIAVTGWNRTVTIFEDDAVRTKITPRVVYPSSPDPDLWHQDDITCIAFCPPCLIATGSYDGRIVISNMNSGHILHKLTWPGSEDKKNMHRSVEKVVFLPTRLSIPTAATLISAGADGVIRWWRFETGELLWEMNMAHGKDEGIYAMCVDETNGTLFTGDSRGWVRIYDISQTCIEEREYITPPAVKAVFQCHIRSIVSIELFEDNYIVTASYDGTARLFTVRRSRGFQIFVSNLYMLSGRLGEPLLVYLVRKYNGIYQLPISFLRKKSQMMFDSKRRCSKRKRNSKKQLVAS